MTISFSFLDPDTVKCRYGTEESIIASRSPQKSVMYDFGNKKAER
jgi:hypothetical protein